MAGRVIIPVAEFIDPGLRDNVNTIIGLSYRPANHVAWRAATTTLSRTWLYPPSQGSMNSATVEPQLLPGCAAA